MNPSPSPNLDTLIHAVNSKCASLKSAAALLKNAPSKEAQELLGLMLDEARALAREIEGVVQK